MFQQLLAPLYMLFILKQRVYNGENDENNTRYGDELNGSGVVCTGIQMHKDIGKHHDQRNNASDERPVIELAIAGNFFRHRPYIVVQQIVHSQFPADPQADSQVGQCP